MPSSAENGSLERVVESYADGAATAKKSRSLRVFSLGAGDVICAKMRNDHGVNLSISTLSYRVVWPTTGQMADGPGGVSTPLTSI